MTDQSFELPAPSSPQEPSSAPEVAPESTPSPAASVKTPMLEAPAAVPVVQASQAIDAVPIAPDDRTKLDDTVARYLDSVSNLDTHSQVFSEKVKDIDRLGDEDIRASARVSNRLLEKPLAAMQTGGLTQTSSISRSLLTLRRQIEDLDPARQGDLLSPRRLLGVLPFGAGNRLRDYFNKYRTSQHQIDVIITSLYHGQDELLRDTASIEQEKANLWAVMGRLRQYSYLAQRLDDALSARIAETEATDPERAKVLKEELLFPIRQKNEDLLTQLAVSVQGYLALDMIRRNNLELSKGVQRATTTTISALRTAVIVAQALGDQRLVLDQITALNTTTSNLIESTSDLLHQQSRAISEQAASSTVELAKLKAAFANIYAAMDELDTFKVAALDRMQQTVTALSAEISKSQAYLDRVRADEARGQGVVPESGKT